MANACDLLFSGRFVEAPEALTMGLVNRVVPHDELLPTAQAWARRLADGPLLANAMTKRMVNNEWNMDLASAIESEAQAQALLMMGEDHRLFYEAFLEKAKPRFTGR
jgi:enoyl-CoA hydratase/carnithine racemase